MPRSDSDDELRDAILGVDPRSRATSGTGAAFGSIYSPQPADSAAAGEQASQVPSLPYRYGPEYEGLRNPLYQHQPDASPQAEESLEASRPPVLPLDTTPEEYTRWLSAPHDEPPAALPQGLTSDHPQRLSPSSVSPFYEEESAELERPPLRFEDDLFDEPSSAPLSDTAAPRDRLDEFRAPP